MKVRNRDGEQKSYGLTWKLTHNVKDPLLLDTARLEIVEDTEEDY